MSKNLILKDSSFLAKGGERDCYIHPEDKTKVIKIVHRQEKHNEQNKLEYKYFHFLKQKEIPLLHIPKCFGFISTNLGEGLVYERVMNYNAVPSVCFQKYLEKKVFSKEEELSLVNELKEYLFKYDILFIDVDLSNIFCQEVHEGEYRLMIIDGLGARRLNWRFYLYLFSSLFTRYKIKKQWKKFFNNYLKHSTYDINNEKDNLV
jgi:hypothetical protein